MDELVWRGVWFEFMKINFEKDYLRELYEKERLRTRNTGFSRRLSRDT